MTLAPSRCARWAFLLPTEPWLRALRTMSHSFCMRFIVLSVFFFFLKQIKLNYTSLLRNDEKYARTFGINPKKKENYFLCLELCILVQFCA
jgi:hypothetical protein